jgi:hypothetical protein
MTRDEVLERLRVEKTAFDLLVAAIPNARCDVVVPGQTHSPKEIVFHVVAYEELIVERLRAAREGNATAFDRDRVSWEAFNDRIWAEARKVRIDETLERSAAVFADLLHEVERLSDEELNEPVDVTASIDPAWLQGRSLAEVIGVDAFEHYEMHFKSLEEAARFDR